MWLFIGSDPGGINAIIPIYQRLLKSGVAVSFYVPPHRLDYARGLCPQVMSLEQWDDRGCIKPKAIITGTSAYDRTEINFWKYGREHGIPTFAVLDFWGNYALRFYQDYSSDSFEEKNRRKESTFYPDCIFVMNQVAFDEMVSTGIPGCKLMITGNPHFDFLYELGRSIIGPYSAKKVVLFSEPLDDLYHTKARYSFDEYDVIQLVNEWTKTYQSDASLIVKQHPKQNLELSRVQNNDIIYSSRQSLELMKDSSMIFGTLTTALIEALLLSKKVCAVIPHSEFEAYSPLYKLGFRLSASTPKQMQEVLEHQPLPEEVKERLGIHENSVDKIIEVVLQYLNSISDCNNNNNSNNNHNNNNNN